MELHFQDSQDQAIWNTFIQTYGLTSSQQNKFKQYMDLIIQENHRFQTKFWKKTKVPAIPRLLRLTKLQVKLKMNRKQQLQMNLKHL